MDVWDDPGHAAVLSRLLSDAIVAPEVGRLFREMAESEMVDRVAERLDGRLAHDRASSMLAQLAGLLCCDTYFVSSP